MPIYVYETIPDEDSNEVTQFEYKQSMLDDPLTVHPETGQPVKRVISGGIPVPSKKGESSTGSSCCSSASTLMP